MILGRASALKQVAQDLMVKILMICGSDPNNIMMQTGSLICMRVRGLRSEPVDDSKFADGRD
jgi:hypothetical protein